MENIRFVRGDGGEMLEIGEASSAEQFRLVSKSALDALVEAGHGLALCGSVRWCARRLEMSLRYISEWSYRNTVLASTYCFRLALSWSTAIMVGIPF